MKGVPTLSQSGYVLRGEGGGRRWGGVGDVSGPAMEGHPVQGGSTLRPELPR